MTSKERVFAACEHRQPDRVPINYLASWGIHERIMAHHGFSTERVCPFGIRYARAVGDWKRGADEVIQGPLESAESPQDVLQHPWSKPEWFDPEPLLAECEAFCLATIILSL